VETKRIEMATHDGQTVLVIPARCFLSQTAQKSNVPAKPCWKHLRTSSRVARLAVSHRRVSAGGRCGRHHAVFGLSAARASHVAELLSTLAGGAKDLARKFAAGEAWL